MLLHPIRATDTSLPTPPAYTYTHPDRRIAAQTAVYMHRR